MKNKLMLFVKIIFFALVIYSSTKNDIIAISIVFFVSNVYVTRLWLLQCSDMPQPKEKARYILWVISLFAVWNALIVANWSFITTRYAYYPIECLLTSIPYLGYIIYSCSAYNNGWYLTEFHSGSKLSFGYNQEAGEMEMHFSGNKKNIEAAYHSFERLLSHSLVNPRINVIKLKSPLLGIAKFRTKIDDYVRGANKLSSRKKLTIVEVGDYVPRIHERLGYWLTFTLKDMRKSKEYWQKSKLNWPSLRLTVTEK
ncbi:MAG: hypothetical protein V7749_00270 [Cocleimonas sp.]